MSIPNETILNLMPTQNLKKPETTPELCQNHRKESCSSIQVGLKTLLNLIQTSKIAHWGSKKQK